MCYGVSLCYAHVMVLTCLMVLTRVRKGVKKTFFLEDLSQMWVGGVADSQTRSKPLKKNPNLQNFNPCTGSLILNGTESRPGGVNLSLTGKELIRH